MLQKEGKLSITISVDTTELDEAIKKTKELLELQEKVKSNSNVGMANEQRKRGILPYKKKGWNTQISGCICWILETITRNRNDSIYIVTSDSATSFV